MRVVSQRERYAQSVLKSRTVPRPDTDPKAVALGANLRALRLARGLTQAQLVELTGILRPNICRLETGRHLPTIDTVLRLARALGVQPSAILVVLDDVETGS